MKFAHIINPIKCKPSSDLHRAQPVTFESIRRSLAFSADEVKVDVLSVQFPEDHEVIPDFVKKLNDLQKSALDYPYLSNQRKLPLIREILEKVYLYKGGVDYVIYTNVDIALMPHFYHFVARQIENGVDSMIINRRTIPSIHMKCEELALMYSCIGEQHPGYDCFVFKREIIPLMLLGDIFVGAAYIGLALYLNLKLFSLNFREFGNEHLTFHIGNDQQWKNSENDGFRIHNEKEFEKIRLQLASEHSNVGEIVESAFPNMPAKAKDEKTRKNWLALLGEYLRR